MFILFSCLEREQLVVFWCVLCGVPPGVQQRDVPVLLHNKTGWADHSQKMLSWSAGTESLSPSLSQPSSVSCKTGNCLIWFCSLAAIRWQLFESRRLSALWKQFRFSEWLTHICSPFFSSHSWSDSCSTWTPFWTLTGLDYCLVDPLFLPGRDILKTFSLCGRHFFWVHTNLVLLMRRTSWDLVLMGNLKESRSNQRVVCCSLSTSIPLIQNTVVVVDLQWGKKSI